MKPPDHFYVIALMFVVAFGGFLAISFVGSGGSDVAKELTIAFAGGLLGAAIPRTPPQ